MKNLFSKNLRIILASLLWAGSWAFVGPVAAATKMEKLTTSAEEAVSNFFSTAEDYPYHHVFYFGPGQTYLHGKYAKQGEDKMKNEFYYLFRVGPWSGVILNMTRHTFRRDTTKLRLGTITPGFKFNFYRYECLDAYALAGLGVYRVDMQDNDQDWKRKWVLGWNAGVGINLSFTPRINYAVQGHYHYPFKAKYEDGKMNGSYLSLAMLIGLAL